MKNPGYFLLALSLVAVAGTASAMPVYRGSVGASFNDLAEADFQTVDASGCIVTSTHALGAAGTPEANLPSEQLVNIVITQVDQCLNTTLMFAQGVGSASFENPSHGLAVLGPAILSVANLEMLDFISGNTFHVSVSMTWTGTGPTQHIRDSSHYSFQQHFRPPDSSGLEVVIYVSNDHATGFFVQAEAAGSISCVSNPEDTLDCSGTNFAPAPSIPGSAFILSDSANGNFLQVVIFQH